MFSNIEAIPLREDEEVLKIIRRAKFPLVVFLVVPFFLVTVDFFFLFFLLHYGQIGVILFFSVLFLSLLWIVRLVVQWLGSVLLVTNERLIDRSYEGLFHSSISEIAMEEVRDVAVQRRGLLALIGRYGTLICHQSGVATMLTFSYVSSPHEMQRFITDTMQIKKSARPVAPPTASVGRSDGDFERATLRMLYERLGNEKILKMLSELAEEQHPPTSKEE